MVDAEPLDDGVTPSEDVTNNDTTQQEQGDNPSNIGGEEGSDNDKAEAEEETGEASEESEEEEEDKEEFAYDDESLSAAWIYDEPPPSSENISLQSAPRWNISPHNVPEFCTLNRLILKLTEPGVPQSQHYLLHAFLCTYRNFVSPSILLAKLMQRYFIPSPASATALELQHYVVFEKLPVQRAVCSVFITWLKSYPIDFSKRMLTSLQEFVTDILGLGIQEGDFELNPTNMKDGHHSLAHKILRLVETTRDIGDPEKRKKSLARSGSLAPTEMSRQSMAHRRTTILGTEDSDTRLNVLDYPETEIANQLTEIQALDYNHISARELLVAGRNDKLERKLQPHILRQVDRFNNVSAWVADSVMAGATVGQRVQVITRFIAIMDRLLHLNNYNSLAAIYGGLNNPAVHRLTETFAQLTPPVQGRLNEIRVLMSPELNYKHLRRRMSRVAGPCIPYLGVFLHDLVIACEIAPTFTEKGFINFSKSCTLYNIMHEVLKHQGKEYKIRANPRIQMMLASQYSISDEALYQRSLELQPRVKRRAPGGG